MGMLWVVGYFVRQLHWLADGHVLLKCTVGLFSFRDALAGFEFALTVRNFQFGLAVGED
jgi:hypothetical protein